MRYLDRYHTYFFIAVIILFFVSRFTNLTIIPIFNDESTYIRYGIEQLVEPDHSPYSLLIGKEPMTPFLYALGTKVFHAVLFGARTISVIFGFLTFLGIYFVTKKLSNRNAALIASFFYVILPFTLFFDRLALMDNAVCTVAVWSLYFCNRVMMDNKWWQVVLLGIVTGIGLWIKSSSLFYIFLPFVGYVLYCFFFKTIKISILINFLFSIVISGVIFLPLLVHPFYSTHSELMKQYTYPILSFLTFPVNLWIENFVKMFVWMINFLTPTGFLIGVVLLFYLAREKKYFLLLIWFLLPLIYICLFAKLLTSRHILILTIPLIISAGTGMNLLVKKVKLVTALFAILIIPCLFYGVVLLFYPHKYPTYFLSFAKFDLTQYFYSNSSGYGVIEAAKFLEAKAKKSKITVMLRDDSGNPEDAVVMLLSKNPHVQIVLYKEKIEGKDVAIKKIVNKGNAFFVSRGSYLAGMEPYLEIEKKFSHPYDKSFVGIYKFKPTSLEDMP